LHRHEFFVTSHPKAESKSPTQHDHSKNQSSHN
jgi:hypothetical protein